MYNKSAGPSAHIVNIARELNKKQNLKVELLFNGFTMDVPNVNFKLLNLKGVQETVITADRGERADDVAIRGLSPVKYLKYIINSIRFAIRKRGKYDVIIERMWRLGGIYGLILKRKSKESSTAFILEENGPMKFDKNVRSPGNLVRYILHKLQRKYAEYIYKKADAIVVQTQPLKEFLADSFNLDARKIHVIPNGVDTEHFSPSDTQKAKESINLPTYMKVLMYVGSLDAFHDLSQTLDALTGMKAEDLLFVIIGDGVKREEILHRIKRDDMKNVIYLGAVPYETLPDYLNAADFCIAPYDIKDFEERRFVFSPLKILEYMACAKPVISQPLGQIKELVDTGGTGFLVCNVKRSYESLFRQMAKTDTHLLQAIGQRGRKRALKYKWSVQADKYIDLINGLVAP